MKRVVLLVACVAMVLVAGLTFHARANDDKAFSDHTLNDKYGFHEDLRFFASYRIPSWSNTQISGLSCW